MIRRVLVFSALLAVSLQPAATKDIDKEMEEESEHQELSPAAVELDVSGASPLIQALYRATRETKEQAALARLAEAQRLIVRGTDLHAVDASGRTALHWTAMGASPAAKASIQKAYADIAGRLIDGGVDVHRRDVYNNTAFDYLIYTSDFELQTLLLENGGAAADFLDASDAPSWKTADLRPGLMIWIRLTTPVWSDKSRIGDPIEAVVTSPVGAVYDRPPVHDRAQDSEILLPPGTKLNGTVMFAKKAPNKYSQARLVLDFANVVHPDGGRSPLSTRVLVVDNAREAVENNEIHGIIQPHTSKKAGIALIAVGIADPILGLGIFGVRKAYGASLRREIFYPAGTDLMIQIVRPSMLKEKQPWDGWPTLDSNAEIERIVQHAPLRTAASNGVPSDLTNVLFIGSQKDLERAFASAGWTTSDHLGVKTALKELEAAARESGYDHAPLSLLTLNGKPPDLVFQKTLNTISKRHHIRIWRQPGVFYEGCETWIGAATHDIGVGTAGKGTKWFHRIDPWVDREREKVRNDLLFANAASGYLLVDRPSAPTRTSNATGDEIITDGRTLVVRLDEK